MNALVTFQTLHSGIEAPHEAMPHPLKPIEPELSRPFNAKLLLIVVSDWAIMSFELDESDEPEDSILNGLLLALDPVPFVKDDDDDVCCCVVDDDDEDEM